MSETSEQEVEVIELDLSEKLWTIKEIASTFKVAPYTVRDWIKTGQLKAGKIGRSWRVNDAEVRRYANHRYGSGGKG